MAESLTHSSENVQDLSDDEIDEFLRYIDPHNGDGYIHISDVEEKVDEALNELIRQPGARHTIQHDYNIYIRHALLHSILGPGQKRIARNELTRVIREWKIPSFQQVKRQEVEEKNYFEHHPSWRKMRAYWAVHGLKVAFIGLVVIMQVAFGVWQLIKYQTSHYVAAFGWGAAVGKACAGALYPTFFFLLLSMSRYFSTLMRRSYHLSLFFNWDLSQKFHTRISCAALILATIHALGHLSGTFIRGSDPANQDAVTNAIGPDKIGGHRQYIDYLRSLPGLTGIIALGLICTLSLLSMPQVRRWSYNVFQLGHLLVYPIIGLMMAHGIAALLQQPIFGYFLAFPTFILLFERLSRIFSGFYRIKATLEVLDDEAVEITVVIPKYRLWDYTAGQYIFLQVPEISFFQWHPFTISFCRDKMMKLHIKTDGDWTAKLRQLGAEIEVGINGPFGAPAQRFNDFNYSIIIGSGIGITPFSAILADLQHKNDLDHGGPSQRDVYHHDLKMDVASHQNQAVGQSGTRHSRVSDHSEVDRNGNTSTKEPCTSADNCRRTDFHWIVRNRNYLLWLSDLLNQVSISQQWHREHDKHLHVDTRINTHVTAKHNSVATHVFSWLLEMNRTKEYPASPLTGLLNATHFGRPDFDKIFDEHYVDMLHTKQKSEGDGASRVNRKGDYYKVGVFYCGAAAVGEILADKCRELTLRSRDDGSKIEYHFMIEVFG